ncbi:hypothetical protein Bca52824_024317 [Brassica carinata]|uniref:protein-serine/threonine phosphatase n=1 Tax=Brassica carinata TaxID=52824 RepID=A0A8X8AUF1_BRACI|nr:hypothetical protein Bca52824_024317 [Brassica carinata]
METKLSTAPKLPSLKRKRPPQIEIPNILQEIQTDNLRFRDSARQNDAVCFGGNGFGVVSRKGKKKFMEDSHKVAVGSSNTSFFGVYDGHGGGKAADFVAENLHKHVLEMVKDCKDKGEREEAFKAAYLRTDLDFLEEGVVSGACCVTALIQNQEMIVSNLGDCRAVLCRGGVAEALTTDHRAGRDDERKRIENQGGYVEFHRGAWREAVDTVLHVQAQRKTPRESEDESLFKGLVNVSPSSKLRRVSLVKQRKELLPVQSPKCAKPYHSENESPCHEIGSPPSKSRKITAMKRIKIKYESSWAKEASKELVNLAVSRGSMDDITVGFVVNVSAVGVTSRPPARIFFVLPPFPFCHGFGGACSVFILDETGFNYLNSSLLILWNEDVVLSLKLFLPQFEDVADAVSFFMKLYLPQYEDITLWCTSFFPQCEDIWTFALVVLVFWTFALVVLVSIVSGLLIWRGWSSSQLSDFIKRGFVASEFVAVTSPTVHVKILPTGPVNGTWFQAFKIEGFGWFICGKGESPDSQSSSISLCVGSSLVDEDLTMLEALQSAKIHRLSSLQLLLDSNVPFSAMRSWLDLIKITGFLCRNLVTLFTPLSRSFNQCTASCLAVAFIMSVVSKLSSLNTLF